jgi:hypothetical protein
MTQAASQFCATIIDARALFAVLFSEGAGLHVLSLGIGPFSLSDTNDLHLSNAFVVQTFHLHKHLTLKSAFVPRLALKY